MTSAPITEIAAGALMICVSTFEAVTTTVSE
jgi:hypothetical protein